MAPSKLVPSNRAKVAIAAAIAAATAAGWFAPKDNDPAKHVYPPAVVLAKDALVKPWEGVVFEAHWDPFAKIYDICYGKTTVNGKPVEKGMKFTKTECEAFLEDDLYHDYYLPIAKQVKSYTSFPVSLQASQLSGGYNFGIGSLVRSSGMREAIKGNYPLACEMQLRFNQAGGQVVNGLVKRRGMGDATRPGEGEICVSGLK